MYRRIGGMPTTGVVDPLEGLPTHTNDQLPVAQKLSITAIISSDQEDIRAMDAEISIKKARISALKILISPIKDLPHELLSQIFEQYAHGPNPVSEGDRPPWYLGHICSRWRQVALATPSLWNFFVLRLRKSTRTGDPSLEAPQELLRRTGNSPVSSFLNCGRDISTFFNYGFTFLAQYASRLRCLAIDRVEFSSQTDISGVSFPLLETLEINLYLPLSSSQNNTSPITIFDESPNLRRVSACVKFHLHGHIDFLSLRLRWDLLTYLHLSGTESVSYHSIHAVLLRCSSLLECALAIPWADRVPLDTITLQHLKTLKIIYGTRAANAQFLRCLICPSLSRLTLATEYALHDTVELVQRSRCPLTEVKFMTCKSTGFMFDLLLKMPSVKRFSMGDEDFLPILMRHMGRHSFLPGLWSIECRVQNLDSIIEELKAPNLRLAAFTQPISNDYPGIRLTLVIDETEDASKLQGLDRDRLKVAFRRSYRDYYRADPSYW